jgi:hypothetical protein
MKPLLLIAACAALCYAALESPVSRASITAVENSINDKFRANSPDPYLLLGNARGTYLEGYGVLFTVELSLVTVTPPNPFRPAITPDEIASIQDRKTKKIPLMKDAMRSLLMNASSTLEGLPGSERIAMEAILFNYSWENNRGPRRIFMTVGKQKLLDAKARHASPAEIASLIDEQER